MRFVLFMATLLILFLVSPFVWAVQSQASIGVPVFLPSVITELSPVISYDCRDVEGSIKLEYVYSLNKQHLTIHKTAQFDPGQIAIKAWNGKEFTNHKEATVTDKTVSCLAKSHPKTYKDTEELIPAMA